ncbi:MAG: hypothetical protein Pg6C_14080 [Treponemataceae bacterium]|nr:MAG: hypothetical protein Pg6C_14080 [Treponemataceae bacterium]
MMKANKTKLSRAFIACITVFAVLSVYFTGCASSRGFEGKEDIHGLVVDGKNRPVTGYRIEINHGTYFSNETGLFTVKKIKAGTYILSGSKNEYLPIEKEIVISQKKGLIYLQVVSLDEILAEAESLFDEGNWQQADFILRDAIDDTSDQNQDILRFYRAVALFRQEKYLDALSVIGGINENYPVAAEFRQIISNAIDGGI